MDEYKAELQKQVTWYMDKIDSVRDQHRWENLPTDSFYFHLKIGRIRQKVDDIEWLEYVIPKLQSSLALIEKHIEREQFKRLKGVDMMEKLKRI